MESNKHTIENFERFLRDKTDEFRMYPSKRVWYSIYNNMHPGNRLPSVSMSIILIGFLFLIGYLNTSDAGKDKAANSAANATPYTFNEQLATTYNPPKNKQPGYLAGKNTISMKGVDNSISYNRNPNSVDYNSSQESIANNSSIQGNTTLASQRKNTITTGNQSIVNTQQATTERLDENFAKQQPENTYLVAIEKRNGAFKENNGLNVPSGSINQSEVFEIENPTGALLSGNNPALVKDKGIAGIGITDIPKKEEPNTIVKTSATFNTKTGNTLSLADKAWIEDFALHNNPIKKWAGKLSMQVYITPSIVYRKLNNNAAGKVLTGNSNAVVNNTGIDNTITHKPSLGLETGLSLQYGFSKRIKLKAGVQLNYTRYNAHAYETNHPVGTTITMSNDEIGNIYEQPRMSYYSNAFGFSKVKLHNETYQLSLPVGADFKLASLNNIAWYAGATIQPTFVLHAKSYIISTDRYHYVQDGSLLNRFNLNAGFETYFSYKSGSGYTWQLGPQYRTQIFSTNTKVYSVEERLQNFGFKVGVSKKL